MKKTEKKNVREAKICVNGSLNIAIFKEGRTYIAYAPSLDLVAQGKSIKDAQEKFDEVFKIYLEETSNRGTLEADLLRCGWLMHKGNIHPPAISRFPSPEKIGKDIELTALVIVPLNSKKKCPA